MESIFIAKRICASCCTSRLLQMAKVWLYRTVRSLGTNPCLAVPRCAEVARPVVVLRWRVRVPRSWRLWGNIWPGRAFEPRAPLLRLFISIAVVLNLAVASLGVQDRVEWLSYRGRHPGA